MSAYNLIPTLENLNPWYSLPLYVPAVSGLALIKETALPIADRLDVGGELTENGFEGSIITDFLFFRALFGALRLEIRRVWRRERFSVAFLADTETSISALTTQVY